MSLRNAVQLICYPNRMGNDLSDLYQVLDQHVGDAIGGVHILPLYPSNADSGFSPLTHTEVDPAFGSWADVERISARYDLCLDLTINHISDESVEFQDFLRHGAASVYADLFVQVDPLGDISPEDLALIHIRKEKEPFRQVTFANGEQGRVWCTFTEKQIDLDYNSAHTYQLMERYIAFLAARGVKLFRLDAFGYTTKRIGTSCFLVEPEVYRILEWFRDTAQKYGAETLPEVHDHNSYQYAISRRSMRPYAFALPPLLLHSLLEVSSRYLKHWLRMCPRNQITVLDTHDGICIPDVEGVLPDDRIKALVEDVSQRSADPILRRSAANVHSVGAIYQLTCTFYEALLCDDDAYIVARAIQFFCPGIPQVYYVGLLAGGNDYELMDSTGEARDINRHSFSLAEVDSAMSKPVVRRLLALMRFRSHYPAFEGRFELNSSSDSCVVMAWRHGDHYCRLSVDLQLKQAQIDYRDVEAGCERQLLC
ncbi:sugar phosphorylase [Pseudomonas taeanensis MS-3]|jgi:sucrose phosphorylase|uniref:Sugar phosphorylase n=1 Tax=Pseudomonas taeanensis MS-3 TaxID=1395571 RepID=A0A0A1YIY6_9PSED|nr:sucrose phosphorylase [Pseudomonas taeanensis]KFX69860.1 sugar phosphorylase [Pseudomonas taeanensis MS-3]